MSDNVGDSGSKENRENEIPGQQVERAKMFTNLMNFEKHMEQVLLFPEKRHREVVDPETDQENIPTIPSGPKNFSPHSTYSSPKRVKIDPDTLSLTPPALRPQTPPRRVLQELSTNTPSSSQSQYPKVECRSTPKIQTPPGPQDKSPLTLGALKDNLTSSANPSNILENLPKELSQSQRIRALEAKHAIECADNAILKFFFNTLETIPVSLIHEHACISQNTLEEFLRVHQSINSKRKTLTTELGKFPTTSLQESHLQGWPIASTSGGFSTNNALSQGPQLPMKPFNYEEYEHNFKNDGETGEFDESDPEVSREISKILRQVFKLEEFRRCQRPAINAALAGHDCFIQMPTGGGKSLCFQLPALITPGITFIISLLISLINDQVMKLISLDIPTVHLLSSLSLEDEKKIFNTLNGDSPHLKMVFVTPEKIAKSYSLNKCFDSLYARNLLSRFVIDEVHCVSSWGHDFRPDYVKLNVLRQKYPNVPIMALTASATKFVRCDVWHQLQLSNPKWFVQSLNRPNLKYTVLEKNPRTCMADVTNMIRTRFSDDTGIVYCLARKECEEYAKHMCDNGVNAAPYHADISPQQKNETQAKWLSGEIKVIVATIAFGMGIDKANVRYVIHAVFPKSIEGFYQESGRAGRDSKSAECILYYSPNDISKNRNLLGGGDMKSDIAEEVIQAKMDGLNKMVAFCENITDCRRTMQLNHFGEEFDRNKCKSRPDTACDNCTSTGSNNKFTMTNVIKEARDIVKGVETLNQNPRVRLTSSRLAGIFRGCDLKDYRESGANEDSLFGKGKGWSPLNTRRLINKLVLEKYLDDNVRIVKNKPCVYIKVGSRVEELRKDDAVLMMEKTANYTAVRSPNLTQRATNGDVRRFSDNAGTSTQPRNLTDGDVRRYSYNGGSFTQPLLTTTVISPKQQAMNAQVQDLEDRCYEEVNNFITGVAEVWGRPASDILPSIAVRLIAERLPITEDDMLMIPHVTQETFNECLIPVLEITNTYEEEKTELRRKILSEV